MTAREKVRVARALSKLDVIPKAFEEGLVSYSQVRALTRVADENSEAALLNLAMSCPASELEVRLREMENGELLNAKDEKALSGDGGHSDLPIPVVKRLLCDGAIVGLVADRNGVPLSVGRKTRTVPVGIRRALEARDRTCRYPGRNHARWLDAHHIVHWADGGETNLENLVLLCSHPHKLLHDGEIQILRRRDEGHFFAHADGSPIVYNRRPLSEFAVDESELAPWRKNDPELDGNPVSRHPRCAHRQAECFPNPQTAYE